jgi:hypothetical protein
LFWVGFAKPTQMTKRQKPSNAKPIPTYVLVLAVFTYKINKKEVGIKINKATAIRPRILTSINVMLKKN